MNEAIFSKMSTPPETLQLRVLLLLQLHARADRDDAIGALDMIQVAMMLWTLLVALALLNRSDQEANSAPPPHRDVPSSTAPQSTEHSSVTTFHVNTREVLVDIVALDSEGHPLLDLKPTDLKVSEVSLPSDSQPTDNHHRLVAPSPAELEIITSLSRIEPNEVKSSGGDAEGGLQIAASCLDQTIAHYQLAFHAGPDASSTGYHRIQVRTTRPGVRLFYRRQYYVGLTAPPPTPLTKDSGPIEKILTRAACYYPEAPLSIALRGRFVDTGHAGVLRVSVTVSASALSFLALDAGAAASGAAPEREVSVDYGICNFDSRGRPINFFSAPLDVGLTEADYAGALQNGFPHILQFPNPADLGMTRVVVRDRETGNLGAIDLFYPRPAGTVLANRILLNASLSLAAMTKADLDAIEESRVVQESIGGDTSKLLLDLPYPNGPTGSFGSIIPGPQTFCGDVYELSTSSPELPDIRELDPIGSLYTSVLDLPPQDVSSTSALPGVTPRTELFSIDYHAVFWVKAPGEYGFQLLSDDGAILLIDDRDLISLDGRHSAEAASSRIRLSPGPHTIEVQYYQGAAPGLALELWIRPPSARSWTLFDIDNYSPEEPILNPRR